MSQEKVDLRKAAKAGRKQQNKRDKKKRIIGKVVLVVVILALLVWIGYSIFSMVKGGTKDANKEVNLDSLQNYMQEVQDEVDGTDEDAQTDTSDADSSQSSVSE